MKKLFAVFMSVLMIACFMPTMAFAGESGETAIKGTEGNPYTLDNLSNMTREAYIEAQEELGGTMYVSVGEYSYDTKGTLGNGERNDKPGQTPNHNQLNSYAENGYLNMEGEDGKKNDGANGKNIVFVGGSITSGATGYTSIDNIGTSLLLAVPAYTNVTFKGTTFKNVISFNYQLYTSPWSQLGELKFENCTFNGIIVGATAAQTMTFDGCTFNNYTNTTDANNSNPTWIRPAYGNWTPNDNKVQGEDFKSLTEIKFINNKVTSTRPVKFEYVALWKDAKVTVTGNTFNISSQEGDKECKNVGIYLGAHDSAYNQTGGTKIDLTWDNNKIEGETAAAICLPAGKSSLPNGSKIINSLGEEIAISAREWKTKNDITIGNEASINNVGYETLADAVAAAKDGETVTLLKDIALSSKLTVNKAVTIDGKGHKITAVENFTDNQGHLMLITANATIKDVTLDSKQKAKGVNTYGDSNNLQITFDEVKMLNSAGSGLTTKGGTVTLKDVEISGSEWKQSVDISASENIKNGADIAIEGNTSLKDDLQIIFDKPGEDNVGTITASGWNIAQQDKTFGEDENAYTKRIFTLTKKSHSSGSYTPVKSALEKAKEEAIAALNAAASANKYDEAEQAEVKKLLDKATADIKAAKTEAEVKTIKEAAQPEIEKVLTSEEKAEIEAVTGVGSDVFKAKSKLSKLNGKRAIKVTWNVPGEMKLDGYEVFRSTKRYSGFGTEPYFTTSKTSYTNNKELKTGKTYYYKVRGFVEINGVKYYTKFSTKAFRTIK